MKTIRSQKHQLGSYEINKISLSCFDDKRYIHNNGITSYGHYKIEQINDTNLSFYQISVSILWRRYDFLSFYSNIGIHTACGEDVTNLFLDPLKCLT